MELWPTAQDPAWIEQAITLPSAGAPMRARVRVAELDPSGVAAVTLYARDGSTWKQLATASLSAGGWWTLEGDLGSLAGHAIVLRVQVTPLSGAVRAGVERVELGS